MVNSTGIVIASVYLLSMHTYIKLQYIKAYTFVDFEDLSIEVIGLWFNN